jgi:hypothetical protein
MDICVFKLPRAYFPFPYNNNNLLNFLLRQMRPSSVQYPVFSVGRWQFIYVYFLLASVQKDALS